jgi:hypothetical protein
MLRAHSVGIEMYVAQFPEWHRFVENAAQVQLAESDVEALHKVVSDLIDSMQKQPQLVEPEVPKVLLYLNELIRDPKVLQASRVRCASQRYKSRQQGLHLGERSR